MLDENKKIEYTTPGLISLSAKTSKGIACSNGTNAADGCETGTIAGGVCGFGWSATGVACAEGTLAGGCTPGNSPSNCAPGNLAVDTCYAGVEANVECFDGTAGPGG